jgi:hypothetical protein
MHMTLRALGRRGVALAVIMVFPQWAAAASDPFAGMHALGDAQLDQLRGGFDTADGLHFSFAVERAITVNGELVATTRLVLNDLAPLLSGGMPGVEVLQATRAIVQNGAGNTVAPVANGGSPPAAAPAQPPSVLASPPPAAASPNVATTVPPAATQLSMPPTQPVTTQAPVAAVAPAPAVDASAAAATAPLLVQINAAGQTLVVPSAGSIVTAVQNSVNNQIIQTRTTIDAMLNSLSALRASTLAGSIRQQALDAVRR